MADKWRIYGGDGGYLADKHAGANCPDKESALNNCVIIAP